jgi:hypothetical protein
VTERGNFDPSKYVMKLGRGEKAADYLPVQWRLVWLRDVAPDAVLETEHVRIDSEAAIFKAMVLLPSGAKATGYGNCNASEFADYIGKAETVAIGRALAALGFGTQFAGDFVEDARIADAPVRPSPSPAEDRLIEATPAPDAERPITPAAVVKIKGEAAKQGWNEAAVETEAKRRFGKTLNELTTGQGRELYRWAQQPHNDKAEREQVIHIAASRLR